MFLDENTIVAGRATENASPSLSFFDLSSEDESITPYLTLVLPDEESGEGGSLGIRLDRGIPTHHGPELRVRVPFVVNPSQQILFIFVFFVNSDGNLVTARSITVPLPVLRDWARADVSRVEWDGWKDSSTGVAMDCPGGASFTMGSRFVIPDIGAVIEAFADAQSPFACKMSIPLFVYNMNPHRRMRVGWEPSKPHCQGIPGAWNTVVPIGENGSYLRTTEILAEPTLSVLMTEDNLIAVGKVRPWSPFHPLEVLTPQVIGPVGQR